MEEEWLKWFLSFNITTLNQTLNARDFEKIPGLNPMISCVQDF
jgi:hypothetical protein